jgi:hypothetical protein
MPHILGGRELDESLDALLTPPAFPPDFYPTPLPSPQEPAAPRPPAIEVVEDQVLLPSPTEPEPEVPRDEWSGADEPESIQKSEPFVVSSPLPTPLPVEPEEKPPSVEARRPPAGSHPVAAVLVAAGLLTLGILIGRWTVNRPAKAPVGPSDMERLGPALQSLSSRLDALGHQVEALPAPPDLAPLQSRVDSLAKSAEAAAVIPGQIEAVQKRVDESARSTEALGTHVTESSKSIAGLDSRIAEASKAIEGLGSRVAEASKAIEGLGARAESFDKLTALLRDQGKAIMELRLGRGIDLFKAGQYAAARDVFARLRASQPDDARLWYYSALANGFASGVWTGETEQLVVKGVKCERADPSRKAEIDATFVDLAASGGKDWLDSYRKRATSR